MTRADMATNLHDKGCNCAQSVFGVFASELGLSETEALRIASSFGGGMGQMGSVCGALTGAFMVLGMKYGYIVPEDQCEKDAHNQRIQAFAAKFREAFGSMLCSELLEAANPEDKAAKHDYCNGLIRRTVELLDVQF